MSCQRAEQTDFAAFAADPSAPEWAALRDHYPTCPECSTAVGELAALTALLRDTGEGSAHPKETRLVAFAASPRSVAASERAAIETHLAGCASCRGEVRVLETFDFAALPARGAAPSPARRSFAERLSGFGESVFGVPLQPARLLAGLSVVVVPAALAAWWLSSAPGTHVAPPAQVAERTVPTQPRPPVPESRIELPPRPSPRSPVEEPAPLRVARDEVAAEAAAPEADEIGIAQRPTPVPDPELAAAISPIRIAALLPSELPTYVPNLALAGGSFDVARSNSVIRAGVGPLPSIRAIGTEHVGATASPSPTVYWHLDAPSDVPVELTLSEEEGVAPLLELRIEPPVAAGLHAVRLSDHGVRLPSGARVAWFASLVPDAARRDLDAVSRVGLRYAPPEGAAAAHIAEAPAPQSAQVLAAEGYWLDAFTTLTDWIAREPDAENLRAHRAALLEQAGLTELD